MAQTQVRLIVALIVLALAIPTFGYAEVKSVRDFSGGMVNGYSNAVMQDNMAALLSNYDIVGGSLVRRNGMGFLYADTGAPRIEAIFPYTHYRLKDLFLLRPTGLAYEDDSISAATQELVQYSPTAHDAESIWLRLYATLSHYSSWPWATDWTHIFHRLFVARSYSDLAYVTDSIAAPARPLTAGQPKVYTLNGGGNLHGRYIYKYNFIDYTTADTTMRYSVLSPPSFEVEVENGSIFVEMDTAVLANQDSILLWRRPLNSTDSTIKAAGGDTAYFQVACFDAKTQYWLDTLPDSLLTTSLAPTSGNMFLGWYKYNSEGGGATSPHYTRLRPPGGFATSRQGGGLLDSCPCDSARYCWVGYVLTFVDSLGRHSYSTAMIGDSINMDGDKMQDSSIGFLLDSLPALPQDGISTIEVWRRLACRYYDTDSLSLCGDNKSTAWYRVGTMTPAEYAVGYFLDTAILDTTDSDCIPDCSGSASWDYIKVPENRCPDDSLIPFRPSIIEYHADRLWAAGNPQYPDYLYYSKIGYPTTFASDYFVRVASQDGDGITGLLSIADVDYYDNALPADQLVIFKRNSVWAIAGFTFSDYRLSQLMNGVGLVADKGYCKNNLGVFFVGSDGMYQLGQPRPLSEAIQETVDSVGAYISRSVLRSVGDEIWWSVAVGDTVNNRTLVWAQKPTPHWTSYSFAMRDAIAYDTTQTWTSWTTDRSLILTETDTVFQWNYSDADTLDGATKIQAKYQSKFFFDDPVREKIMWIDLWGMGTVDTLRLVLSMNDGDQKDTVYVKPVFTDQDRDRVAINKICENFSLRIEDYKGVGNYRITGYDIGYMVWDDGKK